MATCGRLRSNIAGNPCTARSFSIQRMVCYGRLGAVVLPSHGRGPRFDPLCAHHASPFGLRMALPARKLTAKHVRRSLSKARAKTDRERLAAEAFGEGRLPPRASAGKPLSPLRAAPGATGQGHRREASDCKHPDRNDGADRRKTADGPAGGISGFVFGCCAHLFGPQHRISPVHDLSPKRPATPTNNPRGHRPVPAHLRKKADSMTCTLTNN